MTYTYFGDDFIQVQYRPYPNASWTKDETFVANVHILETYKKQIDKVLSRINLDRYEDRYALDELLDAPYEIYTFYQDGKPVKKIMVYGRVVENLLILSTIVDAALPYRYRSGYADFLIDLRERHNLDWINPDKELALETDEK